MIGRWPSLGCSCLYQHEVNESSKQQLSLVFQFDFDSTPHRGVTLDCCKGKSVFWFSWDTVKHEIVIELVEVEEAALLDRVNPTRMYFGGEPILNTTRMYFEGEPILMHDLCQSKH